jgi:hypothetical protein
MSIQPPRQLALLGLLLGLARMLPADEATTGGGMGDPAHSRWHLTSIQWIREHQEDFVLEERPATLIGRATKQYGRYTYIFTDGTGSIQLYSEIVLPVGKSIVVRGEIDETSLVVSSWRPVEKIGEDQK